MNAYDLAALRLIAERDGALATIVGIDGSYSRDVGSHLAIAWDGGMAGSLADGCLEAELATRAKAIRSSRAEIVRFGRGSPVIDFRLPCGSGLDILIDPVPDRAAIAAVVRTLDARRPASLRLHSGIAKLDYAPLPRIVALGGGPEVDAVERLAAAMDVECVTRRPRTDTAEGLSLGRPPDDIAIDRWTAILLLFHDHEWDGPLLDWGLASDAFYIGAIGGARTRKRRRERLIARKTDAPHVARIRSPVGLIPAARDPATLALSVLAEMIADYQAIESVIDQPLPCAISA